MPILLIEFDTPSGGRAQVNPDAIAALETAFSSTAESGATRLYLIGQPTPILVCGTIDAVRQRLGFGI